MLTWCGRQLLVLGMIQRCLLTAMPASQIYMSLPTIKCTAATQQGNLAQPANVSEQPKVAKRRVQQLTPAAGGG
jgi:hypothetical protein